MDSSKNKDFEFFERSLPQLLKTHLGQFALIKNEAIVGFYPTYEDALKEGVARFRTEPFLVQEITNERRTNYLASWMLKTA